MQEKMEATSSFLQRMLETSKDIEKSTKQIKIIYVILYVFLAFGMIQQIVSVIYLRSSLFPKAPFVFMLGIFEVESPLFFRQMWSFLISAEGKKQICSWSFYT